MNGKLQYTKQVYFRKKDEDGIKRQTILLTQELLRISSKWKP